MSDGIGTRLRDARLARGEELGDVADVLKIRRSHVVAMESENFAALGASPYVRGHLRNYARHVGIDPEEIVGAWDAQYGSPESAVHDIATTSTVTATRPREPLPRWIVISGLVVVLLAALALIGQLGNRSPQTFPELTPTPTVAASDDTPTTAPSSTATPNPAATPSATPSPTSPPTPTAAPARDDVELLLAFQQQVWVRITVDGAPHPQSQRTFTPGAVLNLTGNDIVEIRYGNAGGVDVEFNGQRLGTPGATGDVIDVVYTPEGATVQS